MAGDLPASRVYDDERVLAFADLHVLRRRAGDGFGSRADFADPSREELDRVAAAVREALAV